MKITQSALQHEIQTLKSHPKSLTSELPAIPEVLNGDSLSAQIQLQLNAPLPSDPVVTFEFAKPDFNEIKRSKHVVKAASKALKHLGYKDLGNAGRRLTGAVGVVGHSGRAYEKFQKGKYVSASKETARAVKESTRLFKTTLPAPINHGLNGVIAVAVVDDFFKGFHTLVDDPSYENIHSFMDKTKLMLGNVDDVQEIAKALLNYTQGQGPEFQRKLAQAVEQTEAELLGLVAKKSTEHAKSAKDLNSVARIGSVTAVMVASLDVARALLAGVEVYQTPEDTQKIGQLLKRTSVAVFSVAATRSGAHWSHGLVSTGLEMLPNSLYDYLGKELLETFDMSDYQTLDSIPTHMIA